MILGLFLAEQQYIGQKIRAEQRTESFSKDDSRSEDADHNQQHRKVNDCHQYGAEQETDADKQCIFEHCADCIVESCKEREDIHQDDGVSGRSNTENCGAECPEYIFKPHMIQDIAVGCEDHSQGKQDQPYQGGLSEIVPEGTEKCFRDISLFIS